MLIATSRMTPEAVSVKPPGSSSGTASLTLDIIEVHAAFATAIVHLLYGKEEWEQFGLKAFSACIKTLSTAVRSRLGPHPSEQNLDSLLTDLLPYLSITGESHSSILIDNLPVSQ